MSYDMRSRRLPAHKRRALEISRADLADALLSARRYAFLQSALSIPNEAGASFRADANTALQALATKSSAATAPSTTYAYQYWADTTTNLLKQRNAANSAWIVVRTLDESFVLSRAANTILGQSDVFKTIRATGSYTQTFTAAATLGDNWIVDYINEGTGVITLDPNLSETIGGQTTWALRAGESCRIACNGTSFQFLFYSRESGAIAAGRNISARTDATTPNTKLNIAADELVLKDGNGNAFVAKSVSVTIDFGTVGANGLDSGTQVLSTWYYGWVIAKADGTVAGLGSTSATAPTMPTGYIFKALVTSARSDASVHFIKYRQFGNEVWFEAAQSALSGGAATIETAISLSSFVPPIATGIQLQDLFTMTGDVNGNVVFTLRYRVVTGSDHYIADRGVAQNGSASNTGIIRGEPMYFPNVSQQVFYIIAFTVGSAPSLAVYVRGFKLPGGGE